MKLMIFVAVSIIMLPLLALAQNVPAQATLELKGSFDVMKANVAKITEFGEKERWTANVDLWQIKLMQKGEISKAELEKMIALLDRTKANVAKVTEAAEKERWQANITLWQTLIAQKGVLTKSNVDKMTAPFATIKANVAEITEPEEMERWQVNRDMWQMVIDAAASGSR